MTVPITAEEAQNLLMAEEFVGTFDASGRWPNIITVGALRTVIALHAELAQAKADAKAAVALVVQRAEAECRLIADRFRSRMSGTTLADASYRLAEAEAVDKCADAIRALANVDGMALLAELRAAAVLAQPVYSRRKLEAERDGLAAANAALQEQVKGLVGTYWKLRSYAIHDDNCKVNKPPYKVGSCSCGLSKELKDGEIAALATVQAKEGGE